MLTPGEIRDIAHELNALLGNVRLRLLTVQQAGTYIGRSPKAVRCMIARGILPKVSGDARVMVDIKDLDQWIEDSK
jgi:Helix-turn-helix domain